MYKVLKKGSKNFDVHALQQLINETKITTLKVDGDFGKATEEAVKLVQYRLGLKNDGIVGKKTWTELYEDTNINTLGLSDFVYAGLTEDQYGTQYQKKDIIVLHHTAGSENPFYVRDHFQKKPQKVATCYVIGGKGEHDGLVLQLFKHTSQWASHLNIWDNFNVFGRSRFDSSAKNRSHETQMAKRTLGIEVCNYGYLEFLDGEYWFMSRGKKAKAIPAEDVIDYGVKGYRGKRYYQKYTDKQIASLKEIIVQACKYYGIKLDKPSGGFTDRWFDYSWDAVRGYQNIISHSSVRSKSDMHPQPELVKMLNTL